MDIERFLDEVKDWADEDGDIKAAVLVGSYARGEQRADSDIDICILTCNTGKLLSHVSLFARFGAILKTDIEHYGAVTSLRVWYKNGFEVEFGITGPEWISRPLDAGTREVLKGGFRVIADKEGLLKDIQL
jgi:predicted nucleotidyltransferase